MASQVTLRALGLNYSPNNLALPEGSLTVANDVIIRRDNVVESRRGFREYSQDFGIPEDRSKQLISYKDRILNHYNDILQYDTGTFDDDGKAIFEDFAGSFLETEPGLRIKSIEANKNLYFTTSTGIKKIAARSAADFTTASGFIKSAGAVKAVNFSAELALAQGQQTGFLGLDSTVAYRVVWGYKDLNENLILGAPSDSIGVYNYLSNVCALDINALCNTLDNLTQNTAPYESVIHNITSNALSQNFTGTFSDTFYTSVSDVAETMRNNLVNIATNIDRFSALAQDSTAVGPVAPLLISTIELTASEGIVTFSTGDATTIFRTNDLIELQGISTAGISALNNPTTTTNRLFYTINSVTSTQIRFLHKIDPAPTPVAAAAPGITTQIYSYNYRGIINTPQPDVTAESSPVLPASLVAMQIPIDATNEVYATIYSNVYYIIAQLKDDAAIVNSNYISSALSETYLQYLNSTAAANVKLVINIPSTIQYSTDYFVQVYRTSVVSASNEQILGGGGDNGVSAGDEMKLVYEAFPTIAEYAALEMTVLDTYPDDLQRANVPLYTNPASGEGILQANDIPPIAKDINSFKNVTFYANTKTRHRLVSFTLLGTSNITDGDKFIVTDGTTLGTTEYEFVYGLKEQTQFVFGGTAASYANKYFTINSKDNKNEYIVFYKVNNKNISSASFLGNTLTVNTSANHNLTTNDEVNMYNLVTGASDPVIDGLYPVTVTGLTQFTIQIPTITSLSATNAFFTPYIDGKITKTVDIYSTDTTVDIAKKTINVINNLVYDFTASYTAASTMFVENIEEGLADPATAGTIGAGTLAITIVQNGNGEDAANGKILLSQLISRAQAIDITARSIVSVVNQNVNSPINAYYASSVNTLPGIMNFESKTLLDIPFYIMSVKTAVGASFSPDIGPINSEDQPSTAYITGVSVANPTTITTNAPHGLMTGDKVLICGTDTTPSINNVYTIIRTGTNTFTIPVNVTATTTVIGSWSKLSDVIVSSNEEKPNRIYYSKPRQPEAVPIGNSIDVGASDKRILRIFPLRDSLFVFKEDGLFRISGESAPFVLGLFDSSCILIAPDSVSIANNIVYGWTNKGISNISEAGVTEISRPIDTEILKLASSNYTTFSKVTWGVGYDSDNSYTVFTNLNIGDEYANIGFRFSNLTNTWTNVLRSQTCGVINPKDDKIYTGSGIYNLIDEERKQFNRLDYADRDFTINVTNANILNGGETIRITDIDGILPGDVVTQEQKLTIYFYNSLLDKLVFDPTVLNDYSAIAISTGVNLRSAIVTLANLLDTDAGLSSSSYYANIADYTGDILSSTPNVSDTTITTDGPHGLVTGRIVTISGTNTVVSPSINGTYSVTVTGANTFTIPKMTIAGDSAVSPGIGLTYSTNPNIQKTQDLAACYNIIIGMLNNPISGTTFKDYAQVSTTQLFEAVILTVDKKLNQFTVNLPLQWVVGEMQVYKSINCQIQYAPITFNDPLKLKQIYEATMMFSNKAFTKGTASFSSDLKPEFTPVDFYGQGNGIFGHYSNPGFGFGFFGGSSNSAPFRTIIPRESQRCRFINVRFSHSVAREIWSLFGVTLTGNVQESTRAYR
jgi:hypothetical protein